MTEEVQNLIEPKPEQPKPDAEVKLTTPEQMEEYAQLMDIEYNEINPNDKKKTRARDIFYRIVHVYPRFTGIMEDQFIAKVVVERYKKTPGPTGDLLRVPYLAPNEKSAEFHMDASKFLDKYRQVERE